MDINLCALVTHIHFTFVIGVLLPLSFTHAANISATYKYAWSNNVGYINFENITVDDSGITGSAWSTNAGFIKFDSQNGGVSNDNGNLAGSAWGENLGWIDFDTVSIDTSTGKFSGTATGDNIGTLTFDCPTYCDVRTEWRPSSVVSGDGGGGGGSSGGSSPSGSGTSSAGGSGDTGSGDDRSAAGDASGDANDGREEGDMPSGSSGDNDSSDDDHTVQSADDRITEFFKTIHKDEPAHRKEIDYVESYNAPLYLTPTQTGLLVWDFSTPEMT